VLVVALRSFGATLSASTQTYFINSLVNVAIVVALYVFIGSSGVLSFAHQLRRRRGVDGGVLSVPKSEKAAIMPDLIHVLRDTTVGNIPSLALAALLGGICAFVVALPLMRLSGLAAGIATFGCSRSPQPAAVQNRMGRPEHVLVGARDDRLTQRRSARARRGRRVCVRAQQVRPAAAGDARGRGAVRAVGIRSTGSASAHSCSRIAGRVRRRLVRAPPAAAGGGLYLDLTFITLAMLVIGGTNSLWGAVVGALAVSGLDSILAVAENGLTSSGRRSTCSRYAVVSRAS